MVWGEKAHIRTRLRYGTGCGSNEQGIQSNCNKQMTGIIKKATFKNRWVRKPRDESSKKEIKGKATDQKRSNGNVKTFDSSSAEWAQWTKETMRLLLLDYLYKLFKYLHM